MLSGFSDPEQGQLTISGLSANGGAITSDGNGSYIYSPDADFNGTVTLNYAVSDPDGGVTLASKSFELAAINDAPELLVPSLRLPTIKEDTALNFSAADLLIGAVDREGDSLSIEAESLTLVNATQGELTGNATEGWTFTPTADFNGTVEVSYGISDGTETVSQTASFEVVSINDAPTLTGTPVVLADGEEDQTYSISADDLLAGYTDGDQNNLSIKSISAAGASITASGTGEWNLVPAKDYSGEITVSFIIDDGNQGFALGETTVNLLAVNDPPVRLAGSVNNLSVIEDSGITSLGLADLTYGPGGGNDEILQTLSYVVTSTPESVLGDVLLNDGSVVTPGTEYSLDEIRGLSFRTAEDAYGEAEFTLQVSDELGASLTESVAITVIGVNEAPELTGTPAILADGTEDQALILQASELLQGYSDRDGDELRVSDLNASNGALTNNGDGTWTFTPDADFNGIININYLVDDGNGLKAFAQNQFTLAAVNDAPELIGTAAEFGEGQEDRTYSISLNQLTAGYVDVDGDSINVSDLSINNGTLNEDGNGGWTFTPTENFNGEVELTYKVTDGTESIDAIRTFTLTAVNDLPVLPAQSAALSDGTEDVVYTLTLADLLSGVTDADNDELVVEGLSVNRGLLEQGDDGNWSYIPEANYYGDVEFSYLISDGIGEVAARKNST